MDLMANPSNRKEGAILISVTMKKEQRFGSYVFKHGKMVINNKRSYHYH